uniref:RNA-directed DNA polymerase n=1 Tax=Trichogramma kaykai TaxID=54128 RepID=A0ABD2WYV9_9HYME
MSNIRILGYYDQYDKTQVYADASPIGLGCVLIQHDVKRPRVIAYGNKSLTDCERRYCQTEKEALLLVWAVEHFNIYFYGKESFDLITDHKPLEVIFGPKSKTCARIERWVLRLQSYNYKIICRPGKSNIADPLSRLFITSATQSFGNENYVNLVIEASRSIAVSLKEIMEGCNSHPEIQMVKEGLQNGNWKTEVSNYKIFELELCCQDGILLTGNKIVIPINLRRKILLAAHEGHPDIVAMKARLRTKVWWPRIDKDAENLVKACKSCTLVSTPNPPNPMKRRTLPTQAWIDVAIDFQGPLPSGHYLFVIVDYFSRYKESKVMKTITSSDTIEVLKEIFSRLGIPVTISVDNGPRLTSDLFVKFCSDYNIRLFNTIPY